MAVIPVATDRVYFTSDISSRLERLAAPGESQPWVVRQYEFSPQIISAIGELEPYSRLDESVAEIPSEAAYRNANLDDALRRMPSIVPLPPLPRATFDVEPQSAEQVCEAAKGSKTFAVAQQRHAAITDTLNGAQGLNVQLTQITLCAMAMDTMLQAREDIFRYFQGAA